MGGFLRRSLGLLLAMALVVAGMPLAHAMPAEVPAVVASQHHGDAVMAATHHGHHCDDQAIDAAAPADDTGQADAAAPCKCLNCSLCVAGFVNPMPRLSVLERRTMAVVYRIDATHLAGIASPIDPGIPILVN
jgi:hypothetical protein